MSLLGLNSDVYRQIVTTVTDVGIKKIFVQVLI